MINFGHDVAAPFIGVAWKYDQEQGQALPQPRPHSKGTFTAAQAEASSCSSYEHFYLTKVKSSFGQAEFACLAEPEKVAFRSARKELDSLVSNGAVKTIEESIAFEEQFPDHVIESKFVDRYKPKEISLEQLEHYKQGAIKEGR